MDRLLFVSADGHAVMPEALWPEYLERAYHEYLPRLSDENRRFTDVMRLMNDYDMTYQGVVSGSHYDVFDKENLFRRGGWAGAWDRDIRIAEMDREGVAAEFVFNGYFRAVDLFFNVSNTPYPPDVADVGVRAYHRWAFDTFGGDSDRLLLVGAVGHCLDLDEMLREATWISDHGFTGTYMPGFTAHPELPPLHDERWEPFWALCVERSLVLVVHGGYGFEQGFSFSALTSIYERVRADGGGDDDAVRELRNGLFNDGLFADLRSRRPLWQLMFGGVFDRHPDLKLMMTEVRADWIPDTLRFLDEAFDQHRSQIPAQRKPSEYWSSNCLAGLSFMHSSEVEHREQIGVATVSFGRDYPHTEGTWPNTREYLRYLFAEVPAAEVRLILGENLTRFLHLDRDRLLQVASQIGIPLGEVVGADPWLEPELIAHFDARCGLSKPFEGGSRLPQMGPMVNEDLRYAARL